MKVPQCEPWVGDDEYAAIRDCFTSAWVTEGPRTREFASRLHELIGCRYSVFAPNGTLALYLALRALGIGPGDEVLVPDLTFIATANAVEMTGARPIFVDVNPRDFQFDPTSAERWISSRTRAMMPVHLWGTAAEMGPIVELARAHNLLVVEDAAQAIAVRHQGRHAGTWGDAGIFSFFADKTLTTAEGGMVVTDDAATHEQLLYLRNQGRKDRGSFVHPQIGYNFRMTDVQSAIGLAQLDKLPRILRRKQRILDRYRDLLANVEALSWFEPTSDSDWVPFRIPLLCPRLTDLIQHLEAHDIEPRRWFCPMHQQPCYKDHVHEQLGGASPDQTFPNARNAYDQGICLPVHPSLTDEQVVHVCETITSFYNGS